MNTLKSGSKAKKEILIKVMEKLAVIHQELAATVLKKIIILIRSKIIITTTMEVAKQLKTTIRKTVTTTENSIMEQQIEILRKQYLLSISVI